MPRRRHSMEYAILSVSAAACILAGVAVGLLIGQKLSVTADSSPSAQTAPSVSEIAERWGGSVAEVVVEYQVGRRNQATEEGNGSGVYVDSRGYFLTNYHVIEDTTSIGIRLADGRELPVIATAYDRTYDVAVLYTGSVDGIEAVEIGSSEGVRVGDAVIAIGAPRVGSDVLTGTLTTGVVSGLERKNVTAGNISPQVGMMQIDAAINAGNSGGALFDAYGRMIAIPTMKIASGYSDSYEGLAFAIPIDVVWPIVTELIADTDSKY